MGTRSLCLEQKYENYQNVSSESFHFLMVKFSIYLDRRFFFCFFFFFVFCFLLVFFVIIVFVIVCSLSLLSVPREGCDLWL